MQVIHHNKEEHHEWPTERSQYALATCEHRSCIYIIGGCQPTLLNIRDQSSVLKQYLPSSIYEYSYVTNKWTPIYGTKIYRNKHVLFGAGPVADAERVFNFRWGMRAVYMDKVDSIYLFGGCSNDDHTSFDDLYQFVISEKKWYHVESPTAKPEPRFCFDMIRVNEYEFVAIGGRSNYCAYLDVWIFNIRTRKWRELTASYVEKMEDDEYLDSLDDDNFPFYSRTNHACCYDATSRRIYVFGGWDIISRPDVDDDDLIYFDLNTNQWNLVKDEHKRPEPRFAHSMVLMKTYGSIRNNFKEKKKIVIFGGRDVERRFSDVCIFDIQKNMWSIYNNPHIVPRGGISSYLITDDFSNQAGFMVNDNIGGNRMGVFGGRLESDPFTNEFFDIVLTRGEESHFTRPLSTILLQQRQFGDVVLKTVVDEREFACHSFIISQSSVLMAMLSPLREEDLTNNKTVLPQPAVQSLQVDIPYPDLEHIISIMYGHNISTFYLMSSELKYPIVSLIISAQKLNLQHVVTYLLDILNRGISVINVMDIWNQAMSVTELRNEVVTTCVSFLRRYKFALSKELLLNKEIQQVVNTYSEPDSILDEKPYQITSTPFTPQILLNSHLKTIYLNQLYTDVNISLDIDPSIVHKAHKVIICCQCEYFQTMLSGGFMETDSDMILLPEIQSHSILDLVLHYLYCLTLPESSLSIEILAQLFETANFLGIQELEKYCLKSMRQLLAHHNAKTVLEQISEWQSMDMDSTLSTSLDRLALRCRNLIHVEMHCPTTTTTTTATTREQ